MLNGTALNYLDLTGAQPFLPTDKGTSSPPRQSGRIHPLQRLSDPTRADLRDSRLACLCVLSGGADSWFLSPSAPAKWALGRTAGPALAHNGQWD